MHSCVNSLGTPFEKYPAGTTKFAENIHSQNVQFNPITTISVKCNVSLLIFSLTNLPFP